VSVPSLLDLIHERCNRSLIHRPRSYSPVAITVCPEDVYRAPETWGRRAYRNLIYFHEVDKGGHFAAWEEPELFSAEIRAAFRSLR
jgi:pimeloyl-ACP methyl ester carboxylesterase